ncbi:hypothetical protein HPB51_022715 [Rhipicephalus microplus]|uniref:Uncharacterized protein n=1 Tax=Rhipicephalus microplus TaxID=6941 RepID=A0A9J6E3N3_RHIMP|nr:hypothetical protein HPB51_022715 [Rhipicephalus microplus]
MKLSIATAVAALCALLALGSAALLGAPMKHDAKDFENYLDEAHYVAATQVDGREFYDTVVEILEAETQVSLSAGIGGCSLVARGCDGVAPLTHDCMLTHSHVTLASCNPFGLPSNGVTVTKQKGATRYRASELLISLNQPRRDEGSRMAAAAHCAILLVMLKTALFPPPRDASHER